MRASEFEQTGPVRGPRAAAREPLDAGGIRPAEDPLEVRREGFVLEMEVRVGQSGEIGPRLFECS
jgi:hypothetical protein